MKIKKFLFGGPGGLTADKKEIENRNKSFGVLRKKTAQAGLKALGWLGNAFNTVLAAGASSDFGQTSSFVNMDRPAIAKARENARLKAKEVIEKATPYISPANHITAWTQGSFNPIVGALKLEQLGPEAQLAGAIFDIATLSKGKPAIRGTVRAVDKGLARAGSRSARERVIAREMNKNLGEVPASSIPEKRIEVSNRKPSRLVGPKTYPMYRGLLFSINSIVNPDGTVNPRQAIRALRTVADYFGQKAHRMENRLENPEWHKTDPTTYDHTKQVARSAWQLPTPKGFTKQDLMVAALGHDFGKMIAGEGHALIGADLARQVFPDLTDAQYTAIAEHMGLPKTPLGKVTKLADIDNGRSYVTDKKGNRLLIAQHNLWASQYGYPTLPYNLAGSNIRTNRAVRSTIARHNSFYRGIDPKMAEPADIQHYMESLAEGEQPTTQGFIRFAATTPRSEGAGIFVSPFSANSSIYGNGVTNLVRRKYKLGPDRNLWFKEGDFEVQSIYDKLKDFSNSQVFNPWERISYPFEPKPNNGTVSANELLLFDNMHYVGPRSYKATGETTNKTNVTVWNETPSRLSNFNLDRADDVAEAYNKDRGIVANPMYSNGQLRFIWRKNRWSKEGKGLIEAKFRPDEYTDNHHITINPIEEAEIPNKTYFMGIDRLPFNGKSGTGLGDNISTVFTPNLLYNAWRQLHWMEPKVQELGQQYLITGNLRPILDYYRNATPLEKQQLSTVARQPLYLNSDIPYRYYTDNATVLRENPIMQKEINKMSPHERNLFNNSLGWASSNDKGMPVIFNKLPGFAGDRTVGHEGNHAYLLRFPQPLNMQEVLERALPAELTKLVKGKALRLSGNDKRGIGSAHLNMERGSTVLDTRALIIREYYRLHGRMPSLAELNTIIDNMAEVDLTRTVRSTGAYGKEYAPLINDFGALREVLKFGYKAGGKLIFNYEKE